MTSPRQFNHSLESDTGTPASKSQVTSIPTAPHCLLVFLKTFSATGGEWVEEEFRNVWTRDWQRLITRGPMKGHAQICYLSWDFEELWITIWAFFLFQNNFYYFKEIFFSYLKLNAHILGQRGRSSRVQSKYKRKVLPHHNGLFNADQKWHLLST